MIKYNTVNVTLPAGESTKDAKITLDDGIITHIGQVNSGNTGNDIINLEVIQNTSRVVEPSDLSFSSRSASGDYLAGFRPVTGINGGREAIVRLTALTPSRSANIIVQVMFIIQPKEEY